MKPIVLLLALSGCALREYDPETARQISLTLSYERESHALVLEALRDGELSDVERLSMETRHSSEIARLRAWMASEEAKEVTP